MKTIICPGSKEVIVRRDERFFFSTYRWFNMHNRPEFMVKRIRMKCTLCGRKIWSSVQVDHDGYDVYHSIPPHKIKHWWKNKKIKHRKERI